MVKRGGLVVAGVLLIGAFLAWMLLKGTEPVQALTEAHSVLGWGMWGLAWLCALAGAALLARAVYGPSTTSHQASSSPENEGQG